MTPSSPASCSDTRRTVPRRPVRLPARLTWTDPRGTTRFASVVTRDVSELGVFVECHAIVSIPLFRLVRFQLERDVRGGDAVPLPLRQGRILSAVYRISPPTPGTPQGLALRLMVDPRRAAADPPAESRATA